MFVIREIKKTDGGSFISLLTEQLQIKETKGNKQIEERVAAILQTAETGNQFSLLAAIDPEDNIVIGFILIQWLKELWTDFPEAFISNFYVMQSMRKKGIGTGLLEAAIQEAKKRKCQRVFLENNRENPIYQNQFYQKRGWKERTDVSIFENEDFS